MRRIIGAEKRAVLVPIDHAVTTGPVGALRDVESTLRQVTAGRPDAIIAHRGILTSINVSAFRDVPVILHMSGQSTLSGREHLKVNVATVEDAIRLGADAVSVHVTLGTEDDASGLANLGAAATAALRYEIPLLAMMQVRGQPDASELAHAARIGAELGASIVKIPDPGTLEGLEEIVSGCYVPVVVAGGSARGMRFVLETAQIARDVGAVGVCVGRNVFDSRSPEAAVQALRAVVHEGEPVAKAAELVTESVLV